METFQTIPSMRWKPTLMFVFFLCSLFSLGISQQEQPSRKGNTFGSAELAAQAGDSCFAATDSQFVQIDSDTTLTSYTVWQGKYYVHSGVTVTVDNTTRDLTNVDVVFGTCAQINFTNSAEIRANNSVFRPCDRNASWRGFNLYAPKGLFLVFWL